MGFADHFVPHDTLGPSPPRWSPTAWRPHSRARHRTAAEFTAGRAELDRRVLPGRDVPDIIAALRGHDAGPAGDAADLIATRSPIALAVTLQAVRRAAELDTLEDVLREEFGRRSRRCAPRLVEGIRALLIDKDKSPKWNPADPALCDAALVDSYFAPQNPTSRSPVRRTPVTYETILSPPKAASASSR